MSLYLDHFGLREPPFRITPHTDFFFTGANRGPTLDALIYAITQDEGIVKVVGEVGSGKTMLCRMLLERLPSQVETLYLANPSLSRNEILGAIADELGVPAGNLGTHSLMRALQDALIDRYAAGKRVVLLIDEAHAMPAESLEEIRLLSNLEARANKLLQIALFAQPELDERLAANDMRQLRERITQHFNLTPLPPPDIAAYLEFRLRAAGYRGPNPFTAEAIGDIARVSQGLSRRINILADKALLAAYSTGTHEVGREAARTAIRDARFTPLATPSAPARRHRLLPWLGATAGGVALLVITLFPPAARQPAAPSPASASPAPLTASPESPPAVPPPPPHPPTATASGLQRYGPLTRQHMAQFEQWIDSTPRRHYFLQLLATDASQHGEIENFLTRAAERLDPAQLRAYRSALSGRDRVGVIYGDYPTREAATAALRELPPEIRAAHQPFPRQVNRLHGT